MRFPHRLVGLESHIDVGNRIRQRFWHCADATTYKCEKREAAKKRLQQYIEETRSAVWFWERRDWSFSRVLAEWMGESCD